MGKKTVPGHCRLCNQFVQLQNSHIVPELFFEESYYSTRGKKNRVFHYAGYEGKGDEHQSPRKEHLLGKCCEERLSKWEDSMKRVLAALREDAHQGNQQCEVEIQKPMYVRLCLLSVLWRAHHSDFFTVQLSVREEKELRRLLLDPTLDAVGRYPVRFKVFCTETEHWMPAHCYFGASHVRGENKRACYSLLGGLLVILGVGTFPELRDFRDDMNGDLLLVDRCYPGQLPRQILQTIADLSPVFDEIHGFE